MRCKTCRGARYVAITVDDVGELTGCPACARRALDLPGLIARYDRELVADAAGITISMLAKLRNPSGSAHARRLNEDHLIAWLELDADFDPALELRRRREARHAPA